MRLTAVVLGQRVVAEIADEVAPHRMDVVGAVLGVVVLDQSCRPVDAEIVGLARRQRDEFVSVTERRLAEPVDPDEVLGLVQAYAAQVQIVDECLGMLLDAIDRRA